MKREALFDTTALGYFSQLNDVMAGTHKQRFDIFGLIRLLFNTIHIPLEVKNEFHVFAGISSSPSALRIMQKLTSGSGFFHLCQNYDSITKAMLDTSNDPNLHKGEREAISQAPVIEVNLLITDDMKCTDTIQQLYGQIRCMTSLTVLASIDLHDFLPNRDAVFARFLELYQKPRKSRNSLSSLLAQSYEDAASHYRLSLAPEEMRTKRSIKRLYP